MVNARWLALLLLAFGCRSTPSAVIEVTPVDENARPRVLCVVAHPDDEIAFAGTLYKTATYLGGVCDLAVITNGEGGFKYSTLAEKVYGLALTDEAIGRAHLPRIRQQELAAGCRWLGVRRIFFLGERDHRYTQDVNEVLGPDAEVWDLARVRAELDRILAAGDYDFLLTLAPTPMTHGHHQAAGILAVEAAERAALDHRPDVLCVRSSAPDEEIPFPAVHEDTPLDPEARFRFDRTQKFGHRGRLDYTIIANWAIAEHRSQGTMQLLAGRGGIEHYFLFRANPAGAQARARAWFERLAEPQFTAREYGATAGTNAGTAARSGTTTETNGTAGKP